MVQQQRWQVAATLVRQLVTVLVQVALQLVVSRTAAALEMHRMATVRVRQLARTLL